MISYTVTNFKKRKIVNNDKIISVAKQTIETESKAILNLVSLVNHEFAEAVRYIYQSNGRMIITGIGKSANIATSQLNFARTYALTFEFSLTRLKLSNHYHHDWKHILRRISGS